MTLTFARETPEHENRSLVIIVAPTMIIDRRDRQDLTNGE